MFTSDSSSSPTISLNLLPAYRYLKSECVRAYLREELEIDHTDSVLFLYLVRTSMNICCTIPSAIVKNVASLLSFAVESSPAAILISL